MISLFAANRQTIKNVLNTKQASFICFLVAYINKLIIAWRFTDLEGDKALYLLLSRSTLNGHLLMEPVNVWGMPHTAYIFNPACLSPIYPLLAAPFLWMTKSNYVTSIIMDALCLAIFFGGLYCISRRVFKQRWVSNILLLLSGFFIYQHQLESTPKDMLAVGLILCALAITYHLIKASSFQPALALLCFGLYTAIALTKFLYSPLVLFFVFFLIANAIITKTRAAFLHSLFVFVCCLLGAIAAYFFFFNYLPGKADHVLILSVVPKFIKGFYPENLLSTFPFVSSSVMNTNFIGVQLEQIIHVPFSTIMHLFQMLDVLLAAMILCLLIRFKDQLLKKPFVLMLITTAILIILMVAYMSLTHKLLLYPFSNSSYTYVQEYRSFFVPIIVIQLFLFYCLFESTQLPKNLKKLLFLLLVMECVHGFYFTVKQAIHADDGMAHVTTANKKLIQSLLIKKQENQPITILTTNDHLRTLAMVEGFKVYSFPFPCKNQIIPLKPTLVATQKEDSLTRDCLSKTGLSFNTSTDNYELQYFHIH